MIDERPTNGYHTYAVVVSNEAGAGPRASSDSVYLGVDVPVTPELSFIADADGHVRFEWKAAPTVGRHGHYVRPEDVNYRVYSTDAAGRKGMLLYSGLERSYEADYQDTSRFGIVEWLVMTSNAAGFSDDCAVKLATGTLLTLPYRETFAMDS